MKKLIYAVSLLTIFSVSALAQQNPRAKEFDFWIGVWETEMSTPPDWKARKGIDSVSYLLGGTLIEEVFNKTTDGKANFQRGYLTFLRRENRWKHTIYDAKWGEYSFYGGKKGDKVVLTSLPNDTRPGQRRETFYNITKDGFDYLWEASYDQGKTWKQEWKVKYKRQKQ